MQNTKKWFTYRLVDDESTWRIKMKSLENSSKEQSCLPMKIRRLPTFSFYKTNVIIPARDNAIRLSPYCKRLDFPNTCYHASTSFCTQFPRNMVIKSIFSLNQTVNWIKLPNLIYSHLIKLTRAHTYLELCNRLLHNIEEFYTINV